VHFSNHSDFVRELDKFVRKHCHSGMTSGLVLKHIHTRLTYHFKSEKLIPSSHLGLAQGFLGHKVYFHHLFIANCNLKKTQHPKCYFYMQDEVISILCCDSHMDNYKDAELRNTAIQRLHDMLEIFKG
jgi:hypothetical protein